MIDPALTQNLALDEKGIWTSPEISSVSYPDSAHEYLFSIEENSFWFRHRNKCIPLIIQRFPPKGYIMDVGGGNGCVSLALQDAGFKVILLESGSEGTLNARKRGIGDILHTSFQDAGFPKNSVDSIGLFDVLEHIEDDQEFLRLASSAMKKESRLYITVPAHMYLWSWTDKRAGHFRRYSVSSLKRTLTRSGFRVIYDSCFFSGLSMPIFFSRALPTILGLAKDRSNKKREATHRIRKGIWGEILDLHWEREIERLKSGRVSHGASIIAVAEPVK